MATSGEGRWSRDELTFCDGCSLSQVVEVIYDDDDDSCAWTCPECGESYMDRVGE